ncbi:MAG: DUF1631 family protein, partial [Gammaproteobacteria bacterium]
MANVTRLVPARSAELLTECQRLASERLPGSLKTVLDKADDALFELANKADSSQRQNLYFDAMRELRLKRDSFEARFIASFNEEFEDSIDRDKAVHSALRLAPELELTLVESDEVEEFLALTSFVESVRAKCKHQLFHLDRRMGYLLGQPDLADKDNPLGPQVIGSAFRTACQQLESEIEVKLTLFKMFDKFAGAGIHQMYSDLNDHLIRRDVLPKITGSMTPGGNSGRRTRVIIESDDEQIEATGPDVFSTLQTMMSNGQLGGGGSFATADSGTGGGVPGGGVPGGGRGGGMNAFGTANLVNTLTLLQQGNLSAFQGDGESSIDPAHIAAGNVNILRTIRETGAIGQVNQTESLTLDIVSILFDYILDDPAIPDAMKALVGR